MNADYTMTGRIISIGEIELKGEKNFKIRHFVVEKTIPADRYNDERKMPIPFQIKGDRADALDNFQEGQEIEVFADVEGREYNGKTFVNLTAWKVVMPYNTVHQSQQRQQAAPARQEKRQPDPNKPNTNLGHPPGSDEEEEIPF